MPERPRFHWARPDHFIVGFRIGPHITRFDPEKFAKRAEAESRARWILVGSPSATVSIVYAVFGERVAEVERFTGN